MAGCADDGAGINGSDREGATAVATSQDVAVTSSQDASGDEPHVALPTAPAPEGPHPTVGAGAGDSAGSGGAGSADLPVMTVSGPQPRVEAGATVSAQGEAATLCRLGNGYGINFITADQGTECHVTEQVMSKLIAGHAPSEDARSFTPKSITVNGQGGARAVECVAEPVAGGAGEEASGGANGQGEGTTIACRGEGVGVFFY